MIRSKTETTYHYSYQYYESMFSTLYDLPLQEFHTYYYKLTHIFWITAIHCALEINYLKSLIVSDSGKLGYY